MKRLYMFLHINAQIGHIAQRERDIRRLDEQDRDVQIVPRQRRQRRDIVIVKLVKAPKRWLRYRRNN